MFQSFERSSLSAFHLSRRQARVGTPVEAAAL
jgi:hypothetical protein